MKEQDVRIGMKVVPHTKTTGKEFQECPAWDTAKYINQPYLYVIEKNIRNEGKSLLCVSENGGIGSFYNYADFEPYINLTETLTKTLQPLIDALSRPEVAKALEAVAKESVKKKH